MKVTTAIKNEEDWGFFSINDDWPNVINNGFTGV